VVPDQSLPADDYIAMGLPSYDRPWTGQDMASAAVKLEPMATTSPEQLPRFQSDRSGRMFARIVARDNLEFYRSRDLPLGSRMQLSLDYMTALNGICKAYLSAFVSKKATEDDVMELMGACLRGAQAQTDLVDEFIPTLSKDDPRYSTRMAGLDQWRSGLASCVSGVLSTMTEDQGFSSNARSKLVAYSRETLPTLVPKLSPPSRAEAVRRLGELVDDPRIATFRPQVIALRDDVQNAVSHPTTAATPAAQSVRKPGKGSFEELSPTSPGIERTVHRIGAGVPDESGWCRATSTGGGFTVSLPNLFNDLTISAKAMDGADVKTFVLGTRDARGVKFTAVAMYRADGKFTSDPLKGIVDQFQSSGQLKQQAAISHGALNGIELKTANSSSSAIIDVYKTPTTVYQLIVEAPAPLTLEDVAADAKRFMDSFEEPPTK
jgi:hypothetical protein